MSFTSASTRGLLEQTRNHQAEILRKILHQMSKGSSRPKLTKQIRWTFRNKSAKLKRERGKKN
jgi:hypothetical protein